MQGIRIDSTRDQFRSDLLKFVNETLPALDRRPGRKGLAIGAGPETLLFDQGLIDSLAILHLIAFIEKRTGSPLTREMIVMKNFRTVDAMVETFLLAETDENAC